MSGLQVLHVDDEPDMRMLVEASLALDASISTRSVASGPEALAATASWRPDVILLDAVMPGMDGLATLKALRDNPRTAGIPVVFLTAKGAAADLDSFAAGGSAGVIPKPFDPRGLAAAIRAHASPFEGAAPAFAGGSAFVDHRPQADAGAVPSAAPVQALLLDDAGNGFALTLNDGAGPAWSAAWDDAIAVPRPGMLADVGSALTVTPLDAATVHDVLGADPVALMRGSGFAGSVGERAISDFGSTLGPLSTGSSVHAPATGLATSSDWLAALMPRGLLH